jgi:outer membrane protein OmpA-like peptidoglycan-associated protein
MDVRSAGESNPIVPNNSPENRSRNRRVTILYLSASQN